MLDLGFYGLSLNPFEKNSMLGRMSFGSRDHKKALDAMEAAVKRNGFALVTAKSGLGKSHVVDRFIQSIDLSAHVVSYISPGRTTLIELYRQLSIEFKLEPFGNKQKLINSIRRFLYSSYTRGKPAIIIIDEAQDLKPDILSELRILMSYDHDTLDVFTLILAGEPKLASTIQNNELLDSLRQRITNHYQFIGLSDEEISSYVSHKLEFAGGSNIIIDDKAMKTLCEASRGVSRTIDHIMCDALIWGIQMQHPTIDSEVMQRAVDSQSLLA